MKHLGTLLILFGLTFTTFAQTKIDANCHLWTPKNLCDISDTLNIPSQLKAKNVTGNTLTCKEMEKKNKNLQGVIIRFSSMTDSTFTLTSKFKNITLKKKTDGKIIHPYAIMWYGFTFPDSTGRENEFIGYMINHFRATEYNVYFKLNKTYDLILLFDSAEKGDRIVVDNFVDVEIK